MARATGSTAQLLAKEETAYGEAATGNYARLPFIRCDLGAEQPLEEDDVLGRGRTPAAPARGLISDQGEITLPIDLRDIGLWLKGLLGTPVSSGAGDRTHVFTGGQDTLPSFTLEVGHPKVPRYFVHTGCMVGSLALAWAPGGRATATAQVIAQGESNAAGSGGGTPTSRAFQRFHQFHGSVTQGGSPLANITAAELTIDNRLDAVRVIRSDGKIEGIDPGVLSLRGRITARFADTILLDAATGDTPIDLTLGWRLDATKALSIALPDVHLPRPRLPIAGPAGVEASFAFQAATPEDGAPVTVTLQNDVTSY